MHTSQRDGAHAPDVDDQSAEIKALRATCRRQAWAIDTLTRVVADLREGARALKAENADLRRDYTRTEA